MSSVMKLESNDTASEYAPGEWEARVNLACAYRLFAQLGWHQLIYNHISVRVPGNDRHFLINPFGLMYREVKASNLLKIDLAGKKVVPSPYPVLEAGFVVHSSVHQYREDVACVMHTHTPAGVAVACQRDGLLPLDLISLVFTDRIAYHELEGITVDRSERERMASSLGDKPVMILRNHGLLATGKTIAEAFQNIYLLQQACEFQVLAQSTGAPLNMPSREVAVLARHQRENDPANDSADQLWTAMRRWMDDIDPSYAQ